MVSLDKSSSPENSDNQYLRTVKALYDSPESLIFKGKQFLVENAGKLTSVTNTNMKLKDNFSQLLILEITGDKDLIALEYHARTWNYFIGKSGVQCFPDDFDTTSIAWTVLPVHPPVVRSVLDEILTYNSKDGIVTTYFDIARPRVDPVVCVNVLNLCYQHGYEDMQLFEATESHIISVLENRSYLNGTRYYHSPEHFLFFLARLLGNKRAHSLRSKFLGLFQERIRERAGMPGDALELSMRILSAISTEVGWNHFGKERIWDRDILQLRELQTEDGSWKTGWLCRYGKTGLLVGNQGLTTALAIKALEEIDGI